MDGLGQQNLAFVISSQKFNQLINAHKYYQLTTISGQFGTTHNIIWPKLKTQISNRDLPACTGIHTGLELHKA